MGKRIALLLTLLLALASCARAAQSDLTTPRTGFAVAAPAQEDGRVALYDRPDPASDVLMAYYSGAPLTVLSLEKAGMVKVQSGVQGASIMGYMREGDLRYGLEAMRTVPQAYMSIELVRDVDIYAYPDGMAEKIGHISAGETVLTCGQNDGQWVQLFGLPRAVRGDWDGIPPESGFVEMVTGRGKGAWQAPSVKQWVLPLEGELSYEQAIDRAIEMILTDDGALPKIPPEERSREALLSYMWDVRLEYYRSTGQAFYSIYLQSADDYEHSANIRMEPDGTLIDMESGNG